MLRSSIHQQTKISQTTLDHLIIQGPSKRPSSGFLYSVSPDQEQNRIGRKTKVLGFTVTCFKFQTSREMEASHRPLQAKQLFGGGKNWKSKSQNPYKPLWFQENGSPQYTFSDAYLYIPKYPTRKFLLFSNRSHICQFTSAPFRLSTAPQIFTDDWFQGSVPKRGTTEYKYHLEPITLIPLDNKPGKLVSWYPLRFFLLWATNTV